MDNLGRIRAQLKHRDSNFFVRTVLQLLVGVFTSLAAPAVILGFFALLLHLWGWELNWLICFLAGVAITIPVLLRMESQAHGPMLDAAATDAFDTSPGSKAPENYKHLGAFGQIVTMQRTPFNGLIEFFLIGPSLAVKSFRRLKLRKLVAAANFDRIVELTEIMAKLPGGVETGKLLGEKGDAPAAIVRSGISDLLQLGRRRDGWNESLASHRSPARARPSEVRPRHDWRKVSGLYNPARCNQPFRRRGSKIRFC